MSDSEESRPQAIETSRTRKLLRFVSTWSLRMAVTVLTCLAIGVIAGSHVSRATPLILLVQPQESGLKFAVERSGNAFFHDTDEFEFYPWDNRFSVTFISYEVSIDCGRIDTFATDFNALTNLRLGRQWLRVYRTQKGDVMLVELRIHSALLVGLLLLVPGLMASRSAYRHFHNRKLRKSDHCLNCRYNLMGNESGVCPECGKPA